MTTKMKIKSKDKVIVLTGKDKEAPIHASNVAHIDPKSKKATRVGFKTVKGTKTRVARRSGEEV
jgi:ribosomal protein L24